MFDEIRTIAKGVPSWSPWKTIVFAALAAGLHACLGAYGLAMDQPRYFRTAAGVLFLILYPGFHLACPLYRASAWKAGTAVSTILLAAFWAVSLGFIAWHHRGRPDLGYALSMMLGMFLPFISIGFCVAAALATVVLGIVIAVLERA